MVRYCIALDEVSLDVPRGWRSGVGPFVERADAICFLRWKTRRMKAVVRATPRTNGYLHRFGACDQHQCASGDVNVTSIF